MERPAPLSYPAARRRLRALSSRPQDLLSSCQLSLSGLLESSRIGRGLGGGSNYTVNTELKFCWRRRGRSAIFPSYLRPRGPVHTRAGAPYLQRCLAIPKKSPLFVETKRGLRRSAQHGRLLSHPHLPLESYQAPLDTRRRGLVAIDDCHSAIRWPPRP